MQSKYPVLLGLLNLVLLIASTTLMYLGGSLINFYLLDKFDFVSVWFRVVPNVIVGLGVASFIVSLFGCFVALNDKRWQLFLYSALVACLFIVQLGGIFAAMELRGVISRGEFVGSDVLSDLDDYKANPATRAKWDALHREFGCCGGLNFNDGYKIWRNADIGRDDNSIPDSCCLRPRNGCGKDLFLKHQEASVPHLIHTHGCVTVVEERLSTQIVPILLAYAGVGVLLALFQLLAVVFACSWASAISRASADHETKSLRSTYQAPSSIPSTPRFDHVRGQGHYARDNMTAVWAAENDYKVTDMQERDV